MLCSTFIVLDPPTAKCLELLAAHLLLFAIAGSASSASRAGAGGGLGGGAVERDARGLAEEGHRALDEEAQPDPLVLAPRQLRRAQLRQRARLRLLPQAHMHTHYLHNDRAHEITVTLH